MTERLALPRRRLVNFRLTEEEYQQLRRASLAKGSRGMSDFARNTILATLHRDESAAANPESLTTAWSLNERLTLFESAMARLTEALDNITAHCTKTHPDTTEI